MGCLWGGGYCSSAHVLQSTTAAAFVFSSLANAYYLCATQKTLVCAFILLYSIQLQPKPMAKVWRRTSWYSISYNVEAARHNRSTSSASGTRVSPRALPTISSNSERLDRSPPGNERSPALPAILQKEAHEANCLLVLLCCCPKENSFASRPPRPACPLPT